MSRELEVKHYKVLSLSSNLDKNAVYYLFDQNTGKVKAYITTKDGIPIPLIDLTSVGSVLSVTGTGVSGTAQNPKVDTATFVSSQLGNQVYLSLSDGKLQVNPITSPDNSIEVTSTSSELQIQLSAAIQAQINSALQPGANISELTNDAGYLTLADIDATDLSYTPSATNGTVNSSTGTDAVIPLAGVLNAGLLSPSEKSDIASAIQPSDLSTVATTGEYSDLLNSPQTKTEFNSELTDGDFLFVGDITQYTDELAQDAVGGILTDTTTIDLSYNDGLNTISAEVKPNSIDATHLADTIPISEFINDSGYAIAADYVPYINATQNVDLGENQIKAGQLELDQTPIGTSGVAKLRWNDTDGTLDVGLKGGNVTLQVGQENVVRVVNKVGVNLLESDYKVVRIRAVSEGGAQGQRLAIVLAQANNDPNSTTTIGLVTENILNNEEGFITTFGNVGQINTTGSLQGETWVDGDLLYLSPIVAGNLTNIKPVAPQHTVSVGYVVYSHATQGKIFVKVDNGYEIGELHDVATSGTTFGKVIGSITEGLYENKTIPQILGYTPLTDLRNINTTSPLLGGGNLTADRTLSIQQSTGVQDGYLSSTDWNTFNNKQPSGAYITSLTGEVTASGAGAAVATLSTSAVTGKILAGLNITGGSISSVDSILSAFGKVQNQINSVLGGSIFQTTWNASTNTPTLTSSVGTKGYYYIVDVAGSTNLDGITDWKVGDWAIYDGTVWRKVDNTDAVSSVNGFTGAVSLTTSDIIEGTNLYYTEGRVSANVNVAANTSARHSALTLGTTNGLSLVGQQLSLALSSSSSIGALSNTDWNTFNNKQPNLGYTPENIINKSDSYTVSSTTTYANTKALVDGLATKLNSSSYTTTPTATAFTHYFGQTASDGVIRPKTLANVKTEIVTTAAVDAAKPNIVTVTSGAANSVPRFNTSSNLVPGSISDNGITISSTVDFTVNGVSVGRGGGNISSNTRVGGSALMFNVAGTNNVAIGLNAGAFSTSSNLTDPNSSIFIGRTTRSLNSSTTNEIVIADQGQGLGSNTSVFGNSSTLYSRMWGNFLVGTSVNNGNAARIMGKLEANQLQLNTTPATASGTPPLLTWNSSTKDVESVPYATFAPIASPAFTGTPTAPTATAGTNTTQIATTAFVYQSMSFKGTYTTTGAATTTFTVSIGRTMANTSYVASPVPTNTLSAVTFSVQNKTTTTFDIVIVGAGLTGTVAYDFIVTP